MAATKTKKNTPSNPPKNNNTKPKTNNLALRRKNARLILGFVLLLLGAFFTLSILSYCFNWKQDQNHLITSQSLSRFLFDDKQPVENWCGRLGAAAAHLIVFRGLGIAALLFTVWLAAVGLNIVNGKRLLPTTKWVRWMALGYLFLCPLLSFTFPESLFPLGGALGNSMIQWSNGFLGKAGSILMLVAVSAFFIFIVFQWDIKPLFHKAKNLIPARRIDVQDVPLGDENRLETSKTKPDSHVDDNHIQDPTSVAATTPDMNNSTLIIADGVINNRLRNDIESATLSMEAEDIDPDALQFTVVEKPQIEESPEPATINVVKEGLHLELPQEATFVNTAQEPANITVATHNDELTLEDSFDENNNDTSIEDSLSLNTGVRNTAEKDDLSFEVKTIEEPTAVPQHDSHITIQSGEPYDPELDLPNFKFPTLDLLDEIEQGAISLDREELEKNKNQIINTLRSFGIEIQRITATVGPTVTLYEIVPAEGVRISKIRNLEDDIALNLAALGIRIIAPIPGKGTIGIEVPNTNKQIVSMRTILSSEKFVNNKMSLPIALGKKIDNENYIVDLATMPHLLMAGATGQGKSVGINAILVSLLYKKHPSQLKFVMVDPKKVELSIYRLIEKHYLAMLPNEEEPIITDTKKVINTVNALCIEMDNRYELLKDAGARNIKEYNDKFIKRRLNPNNGHKFLPFIVLVIDEFADLIMTAGKEVEMPWVYT
jgi:S-DNA-T family DNA segregation ATPase FtsK/SpoIIIE